MTPTASGRLGRLVGRVIWRLRRVVAAPAFPAAAATVLSAVAIVEERRAAGSDAELSIALLLVLAATVPLAFARTHLTAAAVATAAAMLATVVTYRWLSVAGLVAHACLLYLFGLRHSAQAALLMALPFVCYPLLLALAGDPQAGGRPAVVLALATAAAVGLGSAHRVRRDEREQRASRERMAGTLLEHAARGERARIARELHDVVAHHISMISVQAETARLTTPGMPAEGAQRLVAIGDTARAALTEMRRLLGVLREDAASAPTRVPQPGLQQLNDLLDEARQGAAVSTRLVVSGRVRTLAPGIELTAFRIVQEALTNTRRHAPGAAIDVELHYGRAALHLRVRDNGPGPPPVAATGHGLLGMRERAATLGGEVSTGTARFGGFVVTATLPTGDAAGPVPPADVEVPAGGDAAAAGG